MRLLIPFLCLALLVGGCGHFQEDRCPPQLVDSGGDGPQGFRFTHPDLANFLETAAWLPIVLPMEILRAMSQQGGFHYP
jgi:hypothetical protein